MKVATVTLNPAIDQTVIVNGFQVGSVNRSQGMRFDAGGKGVNVASFLADYQLNAVVTGFLGEENAEIFERHFARKKIEDLFIRVPGETRVNIKVLDEFTHQTTDLNTPGQTSGEYAMTKLYERIDALAETCDWIVLSGNLPPGLDNDFYGKLIRLIKKRSAVVLDTSGEALREGLKAGPYLIKPNIHELSEWAGQELKEPLDVYKVAFSLLSDDIQVVVVSMGNKGALFVTKEEALIATPPTVTLKSTVGAGDAMVAGLVAGFLKKFSLIECARLATAFSVSAITRFGRDLPAIGQIETYMKQVLVRSLEVEKFK